jgi:NTP pyrophosphatase (non-canonical NTP hydrolase)
MDSFMNQAETMETWVNEMARVAHAANQIWWNDIDTGERIERNVGELLMLIVSELAEAMEGHRKGLMDDKLPDEKMFDVELADVLIRLLDLAEGTNVNLGRVMRLKMAYNRTRKDHTAEQRRLAGGKKY